MTGWSHGLILLFIAIVLGSMVFFAFVLTPTIFKALDADNASRVIRRIFPVYYLSLGGLSLGAWLLMLVAPKPTREQSVMALVAAGFFVGYRVLVPLIERSREARAREFPAGIPGGQQRFRRWHAVSVVLTLIQMAALVVLLMWQLNPPLTF